MTAMADQECTGSFSFIFSAEWDFVARRSLKSYTRDRYSISLTRRLDMISAVKMLLDHQWVPYHCVEDITAQSAKWSDFEGFTAGGDETALWLYREFLFFSGKVRPLVYNICNYQAGETQTFLRQLRERKPACVILERQLSRDSSKPNRYLLLRRMENGFLLYSIPLTSVQLRLYASGVMNLSLCCNDEMDAKKNLIYKKTVTPSDALEFTGREDREIAAPGDIAWIRDAGRRLFWPYGCGNNPIDRSPDDAPVYSALQMGPAPIVLCDYRALTGWAAEKVTKPEYFEWTGRLIGDGCVSQMKLRGEEENRPHGDLLVIHYFNDDRMYLHNTIVSEHYDRLVKTGWTGRREITNANKADARHKEIWQGLQAWYAMLAADSDWNEATCQDTDMLIRKCEEATDARWIDYGTFYGLYYNSMTQLIGSGAPDYLSRNMDWMYYQMFLLAIMQRSSMQRFYREASGAAIHRANHKAGKLSDALKEKYVFFMNSMWFTEVTEQEQGCDFFDKLRENMGLSQDMELLKNAIAELNAVTEKNLEDAVKNALLPATFMSLGLTAVGALSSLFQRAEANPANPVNVNHLVTPFPWALAGVSFGIVAAAVVYYWLRKR